MINKLKIYKVDQHSSAEQGKNIFLHPSLCACKCVSQIRRTLQYNILLVIEHFHAAILLNPKLTDDNVVDATGGVCPGVRFVISTETKKHSAKEKNNSLLKYIRTDL